MITSPGFTSSRSRILFLSTTPTAEARQVVFVLRDKSRAFRRSRRRSARSRPARSPPPRRRRWPQSAPARFCRRRCNRGRTGALRRTQTTSLTHMATQSMPTVSCLSIRNANLQLGAHAVGAARPARARSMPVRSSSNRPPKPPMPSMTPRGHRCGAMCSFISSTALVAGGDVNARRLVAFGKTFLVHVFHSFGKRRQPILRICREYLSRACGLGRSTGYSPGEAPDAELAVRSPSAILRMSSTLEDSPGNPTPISFAMACTSWFRRQATRLSSLSAYPCRNSRDGGTAARRCACEPPSPPPHAEAAQCARQVVPRTMESSTSTTRLPSHDRLAMAVELDAHRCLPLHLPGRR